MIHNDDVSIEMTAVHDETKDEDVSSKISVERSETEVRRFQYVLVFDDVEKKRK
jgi:hypothetical protein